MTCIDRTADTEFYKPRNAIAPETLLAVASVVICLGLIVPSWPIVIIAGVSIFLLSALSSSGLLLGLIFFLPVGPVLSADAPLRDIATGARIVVFCGFLVGRLMRGQPLRSWLLADRFDYLVLAYSGLLAASVLLSNLSHSSERSSFRFFSYICMYFLITGWIRSQDLLNRAIRVLLWSTILVAVFGIYQSLVGGYTGLFDFLYPPREPRVDWAGRVTSFLNYSNSLAGYLNLVLPLALAASILKVKEVSARLGISALLLGSFALFLTQSRGALVAFSGVVMLAGYYLFKRRGTFPLAATAVIIVTWLTLPLMGRFSDHFEEIEERTAIARLELWAAAGNMFVSSPVIGVGYGNFRELYAPMIDVDWIEAESYDAHNLYLQTLAEMGIVGFTAVLFLFWIVIRRGLKHVRQPRQAMCRLIGFAVAGAAVTVLLHGFVDYLFQVSPQFGSLFWTLLGLLIACDRVSNFDRIGQVGQSTA